MKRRIAVACLFALGALAAVAQVKTLTSIVDFRLPVFNNNGFKTWELRGKQGRYLDDKTIELTALDLKVYSGDESATLQDEIMSPLAVVKVDERTAAGPGLLQVIGPNYQLLGFDWLYEDNIKRMTIRRDVVVTFKQNLGDILR